MPSEQFLEVHDQEMTGAKASGRGKAKAKAAGTAEKPSKKRKARTEQPDDGRPKRPKSAFLCFLSEYRTEWKNCNGSSYVPQRNVCAAAGEAWRKLTPEQRLPFERMSHASKATWANFMEGELAQRRLAKGAAAAAFLPPGGEGGDAMQGFDFGAALQEVLAQSQQDAPTGPAALQLQLQGSGSAHLPDDGSMDPASTFQLAQPCTLQPAAGPSGSGGSGGASASAVDLQQLLRSLGGAAGATTATATNGAGGSFTLFILPPDACKVPPAAAAPAGSPGSAQAGHDQPSMMVFMPQSLAAPGSPPGTPPGSRPATAPASPPAQKKKAAAPPQAQAQTLLQSALLSLVQVASRGAADGQVPSGLDPVALDALFESAGLPPASTTVLPSAGKARGGLSGGRAFSNPLGSAGMPDWARSLCGAAPPPAQPAISGTCSSIPSGPGAGITTAGKGASFGGGGSGKAAAAASVPSLMLTCGEDFMRDLPALDDSMFAQFLEQMS